MMSWDQFLICGLEDIGCTKIVSEDRVHPYSDGNLTVVTCRKRTHIGSNIKILVCPEGNNFRLDYNGYIMWKSLEDIIYIIKQVSNGVPFEDIH
jgi:hypothetical protein